MPQPSPTDRDSNRRDYPQVLWRSLSTTPPGSRRFQIQRHFQASDAGRHKVQFRVFSSISSIHISILIRELFGSINVSVTDSEFVRFHFVSNLHSIQYSDSDTIIQHSDSDTVFSIQTRTQSFSIQTQTQCSMMFRVQTQTQ